MIRKLKTAAAVTACTLIIAMTPTTAHAAWPPVASITNTGVWSMKVCKDWGKTSCRTDSKVGYINKGQNSQTKFKWPDTDGLYVPKGYALIGYPWAKNGMWVKISDADGRQSYGLRKLVNGR